MSKKGLLPKGIMQQWIYCWTVRAIPFEKSPGGRGPHPANKFCRVVREYFNYHCGAAAKIIAYIVAIAVWWSGSFSDITKRFPPLKNKIGKIAAGSHDKTSAAPRVTFHNRITLMVLVQLLSEKRLRFITCLRDKFSAVPESVVTKGRVMVNREIYISCRKVRDVM